VPKFTGDQIREFLRQECRDFCDALTSDSEFARQEIQARIKKLVLTPKETPEGPVLEVSGDVGLLRTGDVLVRSLFGTDFPPIHRYLDATCRYYPETCTSLETEFILAAVVFVNVAWHCFIPRMADSIAVHAQKRNPDLGHHTDRYLGHPPSLRYGSHASA
jgi:hypothetical protein